MIFFYAKRTDLFSANIFLVFQTKLYACVCIHIYMYTHTHTHVFVVVVESISCILVTLWTVACQAPLSMGFPRKNTGVDCQFLLQGIFPIQGSNFVTFIGR